MGTSEWLLRTTCKRSFLKQQMLMRNLLAYLPLNQSCLCISYQTNRDIRNSLICRTHSVWIVSLLWRISCNVLPHFSWKFTAKSRKEIKVHSSKDDGCSPRFKIILLGRWNRFFLICICRPGASPQILLTL